MRAEWAYFKEALSPEKCDTLVSHLEARYKYQDSTIGFGEANKVDEEYRRCNIAWIDPLKEDKLVKLLWHYANRANRDFFNLDLKYINEIQFTRYDGDLIFPAKYGWHHDVNWMETGTFHRKLSMSIILNDDYEGGKFKFDPSISPLPDEALTKGSIICFPSLFTHEVEPVLKGSRYSIVTWVEGPKWR